MQVHSLLISSKHSVRWRRVIVWCILGFVVAEIYLEILFYLLTDAITLKWRCKNQTLHAKMATIRLVETDFMMLQSNVYYNTGWTNQRFMLFPDGVCLRFY